jgi:hypothetical protein
LRRNTRADVGDDTIDAAFAMRKTKFSGALRHSAFASIERNARRRALGSL